MKPLERSKISIRRGTPSDAQRAFHLLTLAFAVDPASRWFFPDAAVYAGCFGAYSEAYGGKAFECDSAFFAGDLDGVALWYPPAVEQEVDKIGEVLLANMTMDRLGLLADAVAKVTAHHPEDPYWYLAMLAVDPARQRQGIASALLEETLRRVDAERKPAFLETGNPANLPLYERFGFEVLEEVPCGSDLSLYPMLRSARPD